MPPIKPTDAIELLRTALEAIQRNSETGEHGNYAIAREALAATANIEPATGAPLVWINRGTLESFTNEGNCHSEFNCSIRRGDAVEESDVPLFATSIAPPASQEAPSAISVPPHECQICHRTSEIVELHKRCPFCQPASTWVLDLGIEYARAHRSTGFSCPGCCAKQGDPCLPNCPSHEAPQ